MARRPRALARRLGGGAVLALGLLCAASAPASAEITGPCEASGTFADGGLTVDARAVGSETVTVPRSDSVAWQGSVTASGGERAISGFVAVDLPPPLGHVTIDSWDGDATATSNEGDEEYDLGSWVPAGVTFRVFGEHHDAGASCTGEVFVEIDGGPFSSPVTPISLALTAVTGAGFLATILPLFRRA